MGTRTCGHITASSSPAIGEAGRTGDWRVQHPEFDYAICTPAKSGTPSCFRCWTFCPDGGITKTVPPAVITSFNKVTAQGAFLLYGALTGVVIFLWSLAALALSRMFRTGGKSAAGGPTK